jgi:SAM-dependent methyltransferase
MASAGAEPSSNTTPPTPSAPARERFLALVASALDQGTLVKLTLAKPRGPDADLLQVSARRLTLRGQACLSFVHRYKTRDVTRNLSDSEGLALVGQLLGQAFANVHLLTLTQDAHLVLSRRGQATLRLGPAALLPAPAMEHDRGKRRLVDSESPFLVELGVTDREHRLIPALARKWKQINKFVEVFAHAFATSGLAQRDAAGPMRVVDFGSGKGYLTFAVHAYLREAFGRRALVTGVELRQELVDLCARVVQKLGLEGLAFEQGDVRSYTLPAIDVMIALHACDTATDHAIHLGLRAGAAIIMCAPCCHKQIRPQLLSPHPLRPILQHGVHLGQQADMLTDGLRALWLEACGYDTQVFEFVSLEHTNKNKMILAVKRAQPGSPQKVLDEIREIKDFYGIREHCLESLLRADGLLA